MKIQIPVNLVKSCLQGHAWIGLLLGAFMYLICLSGTLAVFFEEIERWEQPVAEEYQSFDTTVIEDSFNRYLQQANTEKELQEHMYIVFPSETIPRIKFSNETKGFYINEDGSFGETAWDDWSHLITSLHINLHLPASIGIIVVGAIGALFLGLIISGFLSHPSIFRDAFSWRRDRSEGIAEVDLHNRLSVWGAPFHLMIAMTGTYFGIAGLLIAVAAQAFHDGDREAVIARFFAPEPVVDSQSLHINIQKPLNYLSATLPEGKIRFMIIHDAQSEHRFQEYFVQYPERLIYSENYRFDMQGNLLDKAGYSDGAAAAQIVYSIYRLHFGHFAGLWTKILYFILGFALTVISISGINIWLIKRKKQDVINRLWASLIWGTPASLLLAGTTQVIWHISSTGIFWAAVFGSMVYAIALPHESQTKSHMKIFCSSASLFLLINYGLKFGALTWSPAALSINLALLGFAALNMLSVVKESRR